MTRTRKNAFIATAVGTSLVAAVVVALAAHAEAQKPAAVKAPAQQQSAPTTVQLTEAKPVNSQAREEVTGSLEPAKQLALGFEVGGRLYRISVKKGVLVNEGQVIAQLDPEIADAQVAQAQAAVQAAEAQAAVAADTDSRQTELSKSGSVSEWQKNSATGQAKAAAAQVLAAKAQLAQARAARRRHDLKAPFSGVVVSAPDQIGATVQPGAAMFTIEQLDPLTLKVAVPESARSLIKLGSKVHIEAVTNGVSTDLATVKTIVPSADPQTRRIPVEVSVPNKDGRFTAHTLARARLALGKDEVALSVPSTALASTGGDHVFVVEKGEVRKVAVTVLERGAQQIVLRAPEPVIKVIDNPAVDLTDGAKVTVK
ncbi:MAG: efflux RND transporter periplasmic adaptor subunit [Deltaproteobacteria bacterium]|nr:efflux RND transporter periplasmic adaptor subunit [Deltaproteobacteria bacterium]